MIWFSSDFHFNHSNCIKFCNRPFDTVDQMNTTIINNINNYIAKNDELWFLGDFSWTDPEYFRHQINCSRIHLILGNHDYTRIKPKKYYLFESVNNLHELKVNGLSITLCHFAMRTWNKSHFNAFHLFGHSHGCLPSFGKSFDVGVDTNNYIPYSLDDVVNKMNTLSNNFNYIG